MPIRTTKAQVLESRSVKWTRDKDLNPFYTRPSSGWDSDTLDTMDIVPNPSDETELRYLYTARESDTNENKWDIGLAYIDLSQGKGSFSTDANNPIYSHPDGIGDPTLIYNSDGTPANYQMWVWGEDSNNKDLIRYYHGDAIDTMTEDSNSPVITVSEATGSSIFQPSLTYDAVADEYVLFTTEKTGSGTYETFKWSSGDGVSWAEQGKVTTTSALNEIVKFDGTEHFYRSKRKQGSEAWYAMTGEGNDPVLMKSLDQGNSWTQVYAAPYNGSDESWEDGTHGDYVMVPNPTTGEWLVYWKGGPSGGTAKGYGVATAPEFPGERPKHVGSFPPGSTSIVLPFVTSTIACYPMGQTQGTQVHDTANGRHAPMKGTTNWVSSSAWPWRSLSFDGSSGYVPLDQYDSAIKDGTNPITVCVGFDATLDGSLSGLKALFDHDARLDLQYDPSATEFRFRAYDAVDADGGVATIGGTTSSGNRHVLIGVFDPSNSTVAVYLDGQAGTDASQNRWDKQNSEVALGARGDGGAQYFPGDIGFAIIEQRVWDAQTRSNYTNKLLNA